LSLEKLYYEEGVELADRDMPDYLPTILEFAHYLSSENKIEKLISFENTHLKSWIPELNKKVKKENIKFYEHVIQLIENFILTF
jgi:nitrate reductase assembly molybdenum cofactor insertion protein NarJ